MARYKKLISKTVNNNISSDLDNILKEAENITLNSLNFNKTFKEQGKILCELKYMLSKDKNNDNYGIKHFTCNPIISRKLNDTKFNELFQKIKKDHNILDSKISKAAKRIKSSTQLCQSQRKIPSRKTKKAQKSRTILKSRPKSIPLTYSKNKTKNKTKDIIKYNLNTKYPIVLIKKQKPLKNVFYLNT